MNTCQHILVNNNICLDCGVTFEYLENQGIYSLNHTPQKIAEKSIYKELKMLQIPDNIKIRANEIYQQITTPTKKGKKRLSLVLYCVYHAYKEEDIIIDPVDIADQLGLKKNAISKAMNSFSNRGYTPPMVIVNPVSLIRPFALKVHTLNEECIPDIEKFAQDIMEKEPSFSEPQPKKIAAAFIKSYMDTHTPTPLPNECYELLYSTPATISNTVKEIKAVYNR